MGKTIYPYHAVRAFWNEQIASRTKGDTSIELLTQKRRKAIRTKWAQWGEHFGSPWIVLERIAEELDKSRFLRGEEGNRSSWGGITWEMIFYRADRWAKVLEGAYRDQSQSLDEAIKEARGGK